MATLRAPLWKIHSCPKCLGDIYVSSDIYGYYLECLQCGYILDDNQFVTEEEARAESHNETWALRLPGVQNKRMATRWERRTKHSVRQSRT